MNSRTVFHNGRIYVAIGHEVEFGEGLGNLVCADARTGRVIWQNQKIHRSISSVVAVGERRMPLISREEKGRFPDAWKMITEPANWISAWPIWPLGMARRIRSVGFIILVASVQASAHYHLYAGLIKLPSSKMIKNLDESGPKNGSNPRGRAIRRLAWAAGSAVLLFASCHSNRSAMAPIEHSEDWPQWGGQDPGRNMYSPARALPEKFHPGELQPGGSKFDPSTAVNLKWVVSLGSQTYGNPTISGGKVFVGTNNAEPRDPKHEGDRSILMCFSEAGGEFLWQLVIPKLDSGPVNDWKWLGLLSSAAVEGNRVYLVTTRCEVLCLTTDGLAHGNTGPFLDEGRYMAGPGQPPLKTEAHDADIIWKYDMMDELGVFPHNAANCSVLIFGDTLYVCTSNGVDWSHMNVPSPHSPTLIALNKFTGELLGEDNAGIGFRLLHGSWSSPSRGKVGNRDLIFLGGGDGYCYAFDAVPQGGTEGSVLQTIWKADCNPPEYRFQNGSPVRYPEAHGPSEIIGTPVFWNNRVYVAIGQDPEHGQGAGNLVCIDPTGTGDITSTGILWNYQGINRSMSTVSITPEGLLFVADYSGYLHCLDALTGKVHWVHYLKSHIWGSTLVADGKVFLGTEGGDLVVFAASREKALLHTVNLGSAVYTTPVVANGALYIASLRHLFAFTILE